MRGESSVRGARNEACESCQSRQRETEMVGNTHPCSSSLDAYLRLLHGDAIVLYFRALIQYTCCCIRQTSSDMALLAAVEQMIRKGNETQNQGSKLPDYVLQ